MAVAEPSVVEYGHTKPILERCIYRWTLDMFEQLGNEDPFSTISSSTFSAINGECRWKLNVKLYDVTEGAHRVAFQLLLVRTPPTLVSFRGTCDFLNSQRDLTDRRLIFFRNKDIVHDATTAVTNYIDRDVLLTMLEDSSLKLCFKITAVMGSVTMIHVPPALDNKLPTDMLTLLRNRDYSDFAIVVDDVPIPVHKCVLSARSPVFNSMLRNASERQVNSMGMGGFTLETYTSLFDFIYSGKLDDMSVSMCIDLLKAANMFRIRDLTTYCVTYLRSNLNFCNVFRISVAAELNNSPELLEECLMFIASNRNEMELRQDDRDILRRNESLLLTMISNLLR